jgi:hypothetical protein
MRRWVVGLLLLSILSCGWGPFTHIEIADRLDETVNDFRAGSVLPDYSLAYRFAGKDYPNLQSATHSPEFFDALKQYATEDFIRGWEAHLLADEIETAYSRERVDLGAPTSADWPVDTAFEGCNDKAGVYYYHCDWIYAALQDIGVEAEKPDYMDLNFIYGMYWSMGPPSENEGIRDEWYYDYEDYVDASVLAIDPPVLGDCNGDGEVNIVDAMLISQYTVGMNDLPPNSDVDGDGVTNIVDAMFIAQYTVGLYEF